MPLGSGSRGPLTTGRLPLHPFEFPSNTAWQFVFLVVATLGSSAFLFDLLYLKQVPSNIEALLACLDLAVADPGAARRCQAMLDRPRLLSTLGGMVAVFGVAAAALSLLPRWRIYRHGWVPIAPTDAPEFVAAWDGLLRTTGIHARPALLWRPLDATVSAVAFGGWRRRFVGVSGGLVVAQYSAPETCRAILLHELAHFRNYDVRRSYFAVTVWWAYLAVAALPALVASFAMPGELVGNGVRIAAFTAIVYLARNAVLRSRELYADARASLWDEHGNALRTVIQSLRQASVARWRHPFQRHPDPADRLEALGDPQRLLAFRAPEAFGVGIAAAVVLPNLGPHLATLQVMVASTLESVAEDAPDGVQALLLISGPTWSGIVIGLLAMAVVGIGIWRATVAAHVAGGPGPRWYGVAGALGMGIVLGQRISFYSWIPIEQDTRLAVWAVIGFDLVWATLALLGAIFLVGWVRASATVWSWIPPRRGTHRVACAVTILAAGFALGTWLGWLFEARVYADTPNLGLTTVAEARDLVLRPIQLLPFRALAWLSVLGLGAVLLPRVVLARLRDGVPDGVAQAHDTEGPASG